MTDEQELDRSNPSDGENDIAKLKNEIEMLRCVFDQHARGQIIVIYGWDHVSQHTGYWASTDVSGEQFVGPYETPLSAALAAAGQQATRTTDGRTAAVRPIASQ
jgi:hypothetical protein